MTPFEERKAIYERDGGLCGFCGEPVDFNLMDIDHVVLRAVGGSHQAHNLRVAHHLCNLRAGAKARVGTRLHRRGESYSALSIRVSPSVIQSLRWYAESDDRSLNAQIVRVLREWLKERER